MLTRSALVYLSRQEGLKEFAARFRPFKKLTTRFVAGETIEEAIAAILPRYFNSRGFSIMGGTSEIQTNILAKTWVGL